MAKLTYGSGELSSDPRDAEDPRPRSRANNRATAGPLATNLPPGVVNDSTSAPTLPPGVVADTPLPPGVVRDTGSAPAAPRTVVGPLGTNNPLSLAPQGYERFNPITLARQGYNQVGTLMGKQLAKSPLGQIIDPMSYATGGLLPNEKDVYKTLGLPDVTIPPEMQKQVGDLARDLTIAYAIPLSKATGIIGAALRTGGTAALSAIQNLLKTEGTTPGGVAEAAGYGVLVGSAGEGVRKGVNAIKTVRATRAQPTADVTNVTKAIEKTTGLKIGDSVDDLVSATIPGQGALTLAEHGAAQITKALDAVEKQLPFGGKSTIVYSEQLGGRGMAMGDLKAARDQLVKLGEAIRNPDPRIVARATKARDSLIQDIQTSLERANQPAAAAEFGAAQMRTRTSEIWNALIQKPGVIAENGTLKMGVLQNEFRTMLQNGLIPKEVAAQIQPTIFRGARSVAKTDTAGKSETRRIVEETAGVVVGGAAGAATGVPYGMYLGAGAGRQVARHLPGSRPQQVGNTLVRSLNPSTRLAQAGPLVARGAAPSLSDALRSDPDEE